MKLVLLAPAEVYARWDEIRSALQQCITKTNSNYRPEDAYLRLMGSPTSAWAHEILVQGESCGFIVFTQEYDPDGLVLFVWAIWVSPHSVRRWRDEMSSELERIARECKAKRIRMQSPRAGWKREPFFKQVAVVYEHEVRNA